MSVPHEGVTEGKLTVGDCNATLSTQYPICTDLRLDADMRGERPRLVTEPEKERKRSLTTCHTVSTGGDGQKKSDCWLDDLAKVRWLRHEIPIRYGAL